MRRTAQLVLALTGATVVSLAAPLSPAAPASAAVACTAYAAMPARIALHGRQVVLHTVLKGSAGCVGPTDNGASADLRAPGTATESLRWRRFGGTQDVQLLSALAKTGTYRVSGGDVQLYDKNYRRVSWTWRATTTKVKWAARADRVTASAGRVTGRALRSSKYGLTAARAIVYVQRRPAGTSVAWRTLGSVRPDSHGAVSYSTPTSARYAYRLVFHATPEVWGAVSASVRGR